MLAPWLAWVALRWSGIDPGGELTALLALTPLAAATSPLPIIVALALRRPAVALAGVAVTGAFALAIGPRALPGPNARVTDGVDLNVMTANVRFSRADPRSLVALARAEQVDVLSLQELTVGGLRHLDAAGLRALLPYRAVRPGRRAEGTGLFARMPLVALQEGRTGVTFNGQARARVTPAPAGTAPMLDVQAVHPPTPRGNPPRWRRLLDDLPVADQRSPRLSMLIGDFNATLDHRHLRRLLGDGGYVDAADATGTGLQMTYPSNHTLPPIVAIDHILVDRRIEVRSLRRFRLDGTDHRALVAALELPRR